MSYHVSPQNLLDELHASNIPALFVPQMAKRERLEAIALTLAELKDTEDKIKKQISRLEKEHKRDAEGLARARGGYDKILELTHELQEAVKELQEKVRDNKILPEPFAFGRKIFGSEELGEWHLGDDETAHHWDDVMRLRLRLQAIDEERRPLEARLKSLKSAIQTEKEGLATLTKHYQRRSKKRFVFLRLGFLLLVGGVLLAGGVWLHTSNEASADDGLSIVAIGMVGIGSIILLVIPLAILRRHRWLVATRDAMKNHRQRISELQNEGRQVNQRYKPIRHNYLEVARQYEASRTMFL